jgi:4-diphosphocytidyl-2-C-methyl-D-erythritol kinase
MATTVRSFCKVNLGLAIGPVRPDGFHALTTCYQTLEAHDLVRVEARRAAATSIRMTSNDARVPCDARNTAWKMVELALSALGLHAEVQMHIEKRLPVQGGLGAGSANAVGALLALEGELAAQGFAPLPGPERLRIASQVGSDVPLFLIGGAVLGVGHGEEVYPLPDLPSTECVLALPEVGVSTPQAFRDWDNARAGTAAGSGANAELTRTDGSDTLTKLSRALASAFCPGLPVDASAGEGTHSSGVCARGEDLAGKTGAALQGEASNPLLALVRTGIENDFEEVVFRQHPSLGTIKRLLAGSGDRAEAAALYAALSGSGSALFGLYGTAEAAEVAQARLEGAGIRSLRTKTLPRDGYWGQVVR